MTSAAPFRTPALEVQACAACLRQLDVDRDGACASCVCLARSAPRVRLAVGSVLALAGTGVTAAFCAVAWVIGEGMGHLR